MVSRWFKVVRDGFKIVARDPAGTSADVPQMLHEPSRLVFFVLFV